MTRRRDAITDRHTILHARSFNCHKARAGVRRLFTWRLYEVLFCDGQITRDLENLRSEGEEAKESAPILMWSLDDVLRYVPMSALWTGREYLIERYAQSVFTLGSRDGLRDAPQEKWTALGLGVTKAHENFDALPGVLGELRAVVRDPDDAQSSGPLQGEILPDEQFTAQSLESGLLDHPPLVHIASHFQFKPGTEADSFLLLGDGQPLTLDKIRNLRFSGVDLLTLSACDTATSGVDANGKEVEGFGVLAQRGGAGAVLASLWPVADSSTSELMRVFYAAREAGEGQSKAGALREAQLQLLRAKGRRKEPGKKTAE